MAVEDQGQAPLRYMSVPEKIELGGGGGGGGISRETSGGGARYRPMKVPDKITLEPSSIPPPPVAAPVLNSEEGSKGDGTAQKLGVQSSTGFQPPEPTFMPTSNFQEVTAMQVKLNNFWKKMGTFAGQEKKKKTVAPSHPLQSLIAMFPPRQHTVTRPSYVSPKIWMSDPGQALPVLVDLERRVRTLEHQVQRLTNTVVSSRSSTASAASSRGSNFWYVVTFTGWMMVPLIVVFMYRFKKSL